MLTRADEYPIHQTPEPIAFAGTDRNFYDRYFFNGYTKDGSEFFAAAMGVYPHLNVIDASFSVVHDGVQHNLHASRVQHFDRMDTQVGPIAVEVVEPLKSVRLIVRENEHGISADLTFRGRTPPVEEPRFITRNGTRAMMDLTRMTQNVTWEGWIEVKGERIEVTPDAFFGTRDRSWGVRPIGMPDPQPIAPAREPQFYWLWAPLNFENHMTLYHLNTYETGEPWNTAAVIGEVGDEQPQHTRTCWSNLTFQSGTRFAKTATIEMENYRREKTFIELTPKWNFYMTGIGYMNPDWAHGVLKGEQLAVGYDSFRTDEITTCMPPYLHIQAFCEAKMTLPDGEVHEGAGILEQLILGRHEPSGFKDMLDVAP